MVSSDWQGAEIFYESIKNTKGRITTSPGDAVGSGETHRLFCLSVMAMKKEEEEPYLAI